MNKKSSGNENQRIEQQASDINELGFLGNDIENSKKKLKEKYKDILKFYHDLNKFANEFKFKLS